MGARDTIGQICIVYGYRSSAGLRRGAPYRLAGSWGNIEHKGAGIYLIQYCRSGCNDSEYALDGAAGRCFTPGGVQQERRPEQKKMEALPGFGRSLLVEVYKVLSANLTASAKVANHQVSVAGACSQWWSECLATGSVYLCCLWNDYLF